MNLPLCLITGVGDGTGTEIPVDLLEVTIE